MSDIAAAKPAGLELIVFGIEGMTCGYVIHIQIGSDIFMFDFLFWAADRFSHISKCVDHVTSALRQISSVADVLVDLQSNSAGSLAPRSTIQQQITAIEDAGYDVKNTTVLPPAIRFGVVGMTCGYVEIFLSSHLHF
jgi:copper chaperone CopZ